MLRITNSRTAVRTLRLFAVALVTVLGINSRLWAAEVTATWNGTSGLWTSTTNWSTAPDYPNNGTPSGTTYDAVIDSAGSGPYTVTLDQSVTVNSLVINNANATLELTSKTLDLAHSDSTFGSVNVQAGTFNLDDGVLANATLAIGPSGTFQTPLSSLSDATLRNVTLASNLAVPAGSRILIANTEANPLGLDFNGFTMVVNPGALAQYTDYGFSPAVGSSVNGTVNLTGTNAALRGSAGGLTINAGATINASGAGTNTIIGSAVTNNGSITAAGGATLDINLPTFTNNGTIQLTGSGTVLNLGGPTSLSTWSSTGEILADPVAANAATQTINFTSRFHASDVGLASSGTNGTFMPNGANVVVGSFGVLINTDNTLTFGSASGVWTFQNGQIQFGTLVAENQPSGESYLNLVSGSFLGVKLGADLTLSTAEGRVTVTNGLDVPLGLDFNGHTINVTGENYTFGYIGGFKIFPTERLGDTINGNVNLIGNGAEISGGPGPIIIDSNATITASSGGSNVLKGAITNDGIVSVTNGTNLYISASTFVNHGTLSLRDGTITRSATLDVGDGALTGWGTIAGNVTLSSASSTLAFNIAGQTQGAEYDSLTITGQIALGGNLEVTLADGFVPLPENAFTLLVGDLLSGTFLNVADGGRLTDTTGIGSFLVQYGSGAHANEIVLTDFQLVPEPASLGMLAAALTCLAKWRRRSP